MLELGCSFLPFPSAPSFQHKHTIHPHVVRVGQEALARPKRPVLGPANRKGGKRGNHIVLVPRIRALRAQGKQLLKGYGGVPMVDPHVGVEARGGEAALLLFFDVWVWWRRLS